MQPGWALTHPASLAVHSDTSLPRQSLSPANLHSHCRHSAGLGWQGETWIYLFIFPDKLKTRGALKINWQLLLTVSCLQSVTLASFGKDSFACLAFFPTRHKLLTEQCAPARRRVAGETIHSRHGKPGRCPPHSPENFRVIPSWGQEGDTPDARGKVSLFSVVLRF